MLLQLAFLLFTVSLIHASCPIGTVYDPNFGRCYGYFSTPVPFLAAEKKCNSLGGNLVAPQNGFENSYVSGLISGASSVPKNTWIGANLLMSSSWAWTYNVPMTYTNWAVRNPSVGDCGLMSGADFTWVSVACSTALPFVCSLDPKEQNLDSCVTKSTPRSTTSTKPTTQPATLYPPTDISKAEFDMIFVADSSDSFSPYEYQETLRPIRLAFENMTFNKSRIILAAYDQTPNFVVSNFNSIVDSDTYAMNWIDLTLIGYTGQSGNNIDDVLNYIINTTIPATPFRRDVRKVIVFISSLGWDMGGMNEMGYNNPSDNIERLKEMNVEFIPIAYGDRANVFQLSQFSFKCLQLAHTVDEFNSISQYLVYNLAQNTMQCN